MNSPVAAQVSIAQLASLLRADMDQLLNPLSGFAGGVILQERADLHNQRNFAGSFR